MISNTVAHTVAQSNWYEFTESIDLHNHPILSANEKIKKDYFSALVFFTTHQKNDVYLYKRLDDFQRILSIPNLYNSYYKDTVKSVKRIVNTSLSIWRKKYKFYLLCDVALILSYDYMIANAAYEMCTYTTRAQGEQLIDLLNVLLEKVQYKPCYYQLLPLIKQISINRSCKKIPLRRFIVTSNMSSGKSTLINAIIGKPIARMSEEACTGNISFFYSKPFEDGNIHFHGKDVTFHADCNDLTSFLWDSEIGVASYFRLIERPKYRMCIIDTPGVNSAINKEHASISKKALENYYYDKVIYVLNASKIGSDDEMAYIRWISEHVPHEKVIFVLNKLDKFKINEDDIASSIEGVKRDLQKYFEKPVVCPMSARFALLLKMKASGDEMSPDEEDEYQYYKKKYSKMSYDLSKYYDCIYDADTGDEIMLFSQRCGIYGFEKIIGGDKE